MAPISNVTVIKLGGHAMDEPGLLASFCADVAQLTRNGHQIVIVHGGGPHINTLLERLHLESRFVNGLRVTDGPVLAAVEMALCGTVNKSLTRQLQKMGANAVGISGEDGRLLIANQIDPALGFVGGIVKVNAEIVLTLLSAGFTPVIAPLALATDGQLLNVNADIAAGAIAGALGAAWFLLVSDVPGVLDADSNLLPELDDAQISSLVKSGIIRGGMLPKLECCQSALAQGCKAAIIVDGKRQNALSLCLERGNVAGTIIRNQAAQA
ncbi:MAG: acetylglutamate kinase [Desulfovibrio sp.]|nr:acetylglutamate kinase [Desulfovibrio sp.]